MAKRYPLADFPNLNLPGFGSEAAIDDVARVDTDWQPALSLSIYSLNPDNPAQLDVLTAIRTEGTETHPDVVSTPTTRFPKPFEAPLLTSREKARIHTKIDSRAGVRRDEYPTSGRFRLNKVDIRENLVIAAYEPNLQPLPNREDPLGFIAHELLGRKLGMGEALQKKKGSQPIGTISLMDVVAGFSYAAHDEKTDTPLWEPLIMYGAAMLLNDRNLLPTETSAYRNIGWTGIANFKRGLMRKKAIELIPTITPSDEATVCVRGLCLTTTGTVTLSPDRLRAHLGLYARPPHDELL